MPDACGDGSPFDAMSSSSQQPERKMRQKLSPRVYQGDQCLTGAAAGSDSSGIDEIGSARTMAVKRVQPTSLRDDSLQKRRGAEREMNRKKTHRKETSSSQAPETSKEEMQRTVAHRSKTGDGVNGLELKGAKLVKNFPPFGMFQGEITDVLQTQGLSGSSLICHVLYEDGDEEYLKVADVLPLLVKDTTDGAKSCAASSVRKQSVAPREAREKLGVPRQERDNGHWLAKFERLKAFQRLHGHLDVRKQEERDLYWWVKDQRSSFRSSRLAPDRESRLKGIGFTFSSGNATRLRRPWSSEETETLRKAVDKYGFRWAAILRDVAGFHACRTQGDLKDRWRTLTKQRAGGANAHARRGGGGGGRHQDSKHDEEQQDAGGHGERSGAVRASEMRSERLARCGQRRARSGIAARCGARARRSSGRDAAASEHCTTSKTLAMKAINSKTGNRAQVGGRVVGARSGSGSRSIICKKHSRSQGRRGGACAGRTHHVKAEAREEKVKKEMKEHSGGDSGHGLSMKRGRGVGSHNKQRQRKRIREHADCPQRASMGSRKKKIAQVCDMMRHLHATSKCVKMCEGA
jgi:hypothetical protein